MESEPWSALKAVHGQGLISRNNSRLKLRSELALAGLSNISIECSGSHGLKHRLRSEF